MLGSNDYWIEGIGSVVSLDRPRNGIFGFEVNSYTICFFDGIKKIGYEPYQNIGCKQQITITEVENNQLPLAAYPNPFNDFLIIEFTNPVKGELRLYNSLGQLILKQPVDETTIRLNTSRLPKGSYCVKIISNKKLLYTASLIK